MKQVSHIYYVRSIVFQSRCYFYLVLEDRISIVVRLFVSLNVLVYYPSCSSV